LAQFQSGSSGSVSDNLDIMLHQIILATAQKADLIVFPELFTSGYGLEDIAQYAETKDGASFLFVSEAAKKHATSVLYGFPELGSDGKLYISANLVDSDGHLQLTYRKNHLWGPWEKKFFSTGDSLPLVNIKELKVGILICWDLEMAEAPRVLAVKGADLILAIGANPDPFVLQVTVRSRAFENQVFLAYTNQVGYQNGANCCGGSCIVASSGEILTQAPFYSPQEAEKEGANSETTYSKLAILDINRSDPKYVNITKRNPFLQDRRPELYADLS